MGLWFWGKTRLAKIRFLKLLEERRSVLRKISQNGIEVEMLPAPIFWYNGADG
jgi:DNA repair photolyase